MNLEEILKLPCDDHDFSYEEWKKFKAVSDASHERLFEKRHKAAKQYEESIARVTKLYRGADRELACLYSPALKLEKYAEQLEEQGRTDKFPCILHDKRGSWAWLGQADNGDILYNCPHEGRYTLTLPQVRASLAYRPVKGKAVNILHAHKAEHMVWRLRLLWEAGVIERVHIPHRIPPDYVLQHRVAVYYGLLRLLALKWDVPEWHGHGTTFSLDFGAAWCGLTKDKVRGAMRWLLKNGYVKEVSQLKASFGKKLGVYLPG